MKHQLYQIKLIACDPGRWAAALGVIDQFDHRLFTERPMLVQPPGLDLLPAGPVIIRAGASEDENDDEDVETDVWGDPLPKMEMDDDIAIIPIQGLIATGLPTMYQKFGIADLGNVADDIAKADADPNCRAMVLAIDSPGGTLRSLPELAGAIANHRTLGQKPIAARIEGLGCSAAYYAAAGAGIISAAPSAQMVNIGVYRVSIDASKAYEAFGYRVEIIKSGKYKAAGYPGTSLSDDQRDDLQSQVDDLGAAFRAHVSANRPDASADDMEGQAFFGSKAMALGFADDDAPSFAEFMSRFRGYLDSK